MLILFISVGKNSLVKFKFSLRKVFRHSFKFLLQKKTSQMFYILLCLFWWHDGCCPHYLNIHSGKNVLPNISSSLFMSLLYVVNVVCSLCIFSCFLSLVLLYCSKNHLLTFVFYSINFCCYTDYISVYFDVIWWGPWKVYLDQNYQPFFFFNIINSISGNNFHTKYIFGCIAQIMMCYNQNIFSFASWLLFWLIGYLQVHCIIPKHLVIF